ncbi:MAG TPA: SCO family protein [Geminicoccus sp.]|uniref:SCO family protein n=1 Tax=Geminicoccus sp. TaxID=2024832 RepID=UPI002CD1F20E|nr:SCO family protein [Geminicoccus sp.]HWL69595.1 SCO family protein [Geminicoccus sp.]
MDRRTFFTGGGGAIAGTVAGSALPGAQAAGSSKPYGIPDIAVLDQDGREYRFYDDLIRDRVVLINFFFQSCGDTCPLVTENLRAVQDALAGRMDRDIFMYSITLQPHFDRPHILKDYAELWEVKPGWKFLTGESDDIERLRRSLGFASLDPEYDLQLDNHTGILRYGNDRLGRWAATASLGRPAWIVKAVTSIADVA